MTFGAIPPKLRAFMAGKRKGKPVSRSGRFSEGPGKDVEQFSESISFDWRVWRHDIAGSIAHASMLQKIGVLTKKELNEIKRGLEQIGAEIIATPALGPSLGMAPAGMCTCTSQ